MKIEIINLLKSGPKKFKEIKKELNLKNYSDSKKLDNVLRELWKNGKIYYKKSSNTYNLKNAEEIIGTFRDTKNDYGFVENDDITVFIPGKFILNALDGDAVKVILFPLRSDDNPDKRAGKIVRVMQRNGANIIGRVFIENNIKKFIPDDIVPKHKYEVSGIENCENDEIIFTKFIDYKDGVVYLKLLSKIGKTNDAKLDPQLMGYKFDIKTKFNNETLKIAEKIKPIDSSRRIDITDRLIYTIDGEDSKDLDDAIDVKKLSNGNYMLGVHIADVSHFVKEYDLIDLEARERGTSVYLIDTVFPMLPKKLSNDLCSLNPNTIKFTITCDMEIDSFGKVVNYKTYESKIISKHRLSYSQVDKLYNGEEKILINNDLTNSLKIAKELANVLRKDKLNNGMIDFVLPESKFKLNSEGEVIDIYNKNQTPSEMMIEDLMVITNETIAKMFSSNELPGMFRIHLKPKEENLSSFVNLVKTLGLFFNKSVNEITSKDLMNFLNDHKENENIEIVKRFIIQTMEKAIYDYQDLGHYALGLNNYLHFTSPIRRYPDLIVHRLIKNFFIDKNYLENRKKKNDLIPHLKLISKETSESERIAVSAERRLMDIKKSRFMSSKIGEVMNGKIVSVVRFGFFVEFENLTQGLVHIDNLKEDEYNFDEVKYAIIGKEHKKIYKLGDKLKTKIINVDVIRGLIDLEVV